MTRMGKRKRWVYSCPSCDSWATSRLVRLWGTRVRPSPTKSDQKNMNMTRNRKIGRRPKAVREQGAGSGQREEGREGARAGGFEFSRRPPTRQPVGAREGNQYPRSREAFGDCGAWQARQPAAAGDSRAPTESGQIKVNQTKSCLSSSFRAPTPQPVGARAGGSHTGFPPGGGADAGRNCFHARALLLATPGDPAIAGGPTGAGALPSFLNVDGSPVLDERTREDTRRHFVKFTNADASNITNCIGRHGCSLLHSHFACPSRPSR